MLAALAHATEGKFWPARMELRAYAIYRPQNGVRLLRPRAFGRIFDGIGRTLACGIGSVTGDLILFSLVLLGGHYLFSDLSNPTLHTVLAAIGVIVPMQTIGRHTIRVNGV